MRRTSLLLAAVATTEALQSGLFAGGRSRRSTIVMSDPNQFGQGPSLQWGGTDTTTSGARKLTEALEEADIDRKKAVEEAERRAKWQELEREEKLRKIQYMKDM